MLTFQFNSIALSIIMKCDVTVNKKSTFLNAEKYCSQEALAEAQLCLGSTHHVYQIWPQSGSDWPQMGQIREIFRSDSVHFGAVRQNVLNLI